MRESVIDLQMRSMRDNLLELKLENPQDIDRAHRLGAKGDSKPRPIMVKFNFFEDRERVGKAGKETLREKKKYGISQQVPKEIKERRKLLQPTFDELLKKGEKSYFKGDKLFMSGKEYKNLPK
ncbi:hypothetical protein KUTeg_010841 [Tegillarca granosa]|uniref:Uncharacterized protein n=1 Tax=Tegillarca granosa TaxID=220873 RepID=A0ABQ9F5L1_TEGGR|nr:hypothetical protein KUTeg_010841 [Tegillarca granosa]